MKFINEYCYFLLLPEKYLFEIIIKETGTRLLNRPVGYRIIIGMRAE